MNFSDVLFDEFYVTSNFCFFFPDTNDVFHGLLAPFSEWRIHWLRKGDLCRNDLNERIK